MVDTITRNKMATAISAVHARGAEAMAEGMVRVIKRFWSWLAEAVRQDETSVIACEEKTITMHTPSGGQREMKMWTIQKAK